MGISRKVDIDDDGSGLTGTPHNNAWLQDLQDRIDGMTGDWLQRTFLASDYTSDSGTWVVASGDVVVETFQVINKTLFWKEHIQTSTVTGTPLSLRIHSPVTLGLSADYSPVIYCRQGAGVILDCMVQLINSTTIGIVKKDGTAFAAGTDNTSVIFTAILQVA